jgi:hypothetical protein
MHTIFRDLVVYSISTCLGMWIYDEYVRTAKLRNDAFADYVPSLEGFERMDLQSPDETTYRRGTLDRV